MKKRNFNTLLAAAVALGALLAAGAPIRASIVVYPNASENQLGPTFDRGPLLNASVVYMIVIDALQLEDVKVGDLITGVTWRVASQRPASQPAVDLTFPSYNIYLGQAATTPETMVATFADNYVAGTRTQVRSGPLTVPTNSFPAQSGSDPAEFGLEISFTPYAYLGGSLVLEYRHTGSGVSNEYLPYLDAISLVTPTSSNTGVNAFFATSIDAGTGRQDTSMGIGRLTFQSSADIPEAGSLAIWGLLAATFSAVGWRRRAGA